MVLHYEESICQLAIDFQAQIVSHRAQDLLLRVELIDEMEILSEQTVFFTPPKRLNLRLAAISVSLFSEQWIRRHDFALGRLPPRGDGRF